MTKTKITLAACIAFAAFSLNSCSDDSSSPASIEGKWDYFKTLTSVNGNNPISTNYQNNEAGCDKDYQEFTAGGVFRDVVLFKDGDDVCTEDVDFGIYAREDDLLTIDFDGNGAQEPETFTITKLTSGELRYESSTQTGGQTFVVTQIFRKK